MTSVDAFIAANRFGLGPKRGYLGGIAADPQSWLLRQLGTEDGALPYFNDLPRSEEIIQEWMQARGSREMRKMFNKDRIRPLFFKEIRRRNRAAIETDTPFRERLVRFWSNHFTVSKTKGRIRGIAGAFEREAIRPYVAGNFAEMLVAVTKHPAMLVYLDNVSSIGPNSTVGLRRGRGLNENLAREILELHTLGVNGGYTQTDVIALAKMLTGWTVAPKRHSNAGGFWFNDRRHEPDSKTLLGRRYPEDGQQEAERALRNLAQHPSTAQFIATKLARHFVADNPPPAVVKQLQKKYLETNGNLGAMARELVALPAIWNKPLTKIKSPSGLVISAFRMLGPPDKPKHMIHALRLLGQLPFSAPSPAGWPDTAKDWISPESLLRRVELMDLLARRNTKRHDPVQLAEQALGPIARIETLTALKQAPSRRAALSLLLSSPEFQRR
ncbi:MAG: hypothetical protein CMM52_12100 [Rhodospirillaceae bacterium]|nr:hypothetical protein [Rhodospirillaceae bacterium]|tara:strand:+ start:3452 stop:4777 length:1326 start_codon:yes stop_codon:yes gene_type:complete